MSERKVKMMELSDGCIAMPGGVGTLEEITQSFSWARLNDNPNPCAFYNVNHYYQPLIAMFDQMVTAGFLSADDRQKLIFFRFTVSHSAIYDKLYPATSANV